MGALGVGTPATPRLRALATVEVTAGVRLGGCSISGSTGRWDARNAEPPAVMGGDSNKLARRASKLNFARIDCLCYMDLWDHGAGEGALVRHFWP